ncbi:MAG: hypothetical protein QMC67_02135 [Candidatus Wallbacteria bacterium]
MKKTKYLIGVLKEIMPYTDVLFIAYLLKYFLFLDSPRGCAVIFVLSWISFFVLATRSLISFWKGYFCTGMVADDKIFASYLVTAILCFGAQILSLMESASANKIIITSVILIANIISLITFSYYFFLIIFAFNYFLLLFNISYFLKWIN